MLFMILTCGQARSATTSIHSPENAEHATAQRAWIQAERRLAVGYEVARHCRRFRARPMVRFRHFQWVDRHKYRWFRSLASDCRHLDGYRKDRRPQRASFSVFLRGSSGVHSIPAMDSPPIDSDS
jgi:hypothetical protein